MNWNLLTTRQQTLQVLRVLKSLSASDGVVSQQERVFMQQLGQQHGLTSIEVASELGNGEDEVILPLEEQERMTVLYYLVFLMQSDGDITKEEEVSIYHFGHRLGFREELLRNFIELANKYQGQAIPAEKMLEKVRVFMN
ncbi:MAG: hypothetical protein AB8F78_05970 [Saprospiraceae bacterium]